MVLSGIFIMNYVILLLLPALCASQSLKIQPALEVYKLDVTQEHSAVSFECTTENALPVKDAQLEWYDINGQRIPSNAEGDGEKHIFTTLKGETVLMMAIPAPDINNDNGRYTCKGVLQGNNVEASITLQLYKGIQLLSPTTQYPLLGHDEKINCTTTASLSTEISWAFHNWQPIPGGGRYITQGDFLLIKNVTEADDGTYYCRVALSNGDTKMYPIKVIGSKVPVMTGPVTSLPPSPKAGDTVELTCMATGRPTPTYKFYKVEGSNDIPITPESVTNGKLILKDITQETEGKYKCEASNIKGSTSQEFPIDVMIPPKIDPIETLSGTEEARGQLSCSAVGDPQPSVTWKREDQNYYYVEQPSGDDRIYVAIERTQEGEKNERKRTTATLVFKTLQPDDMHNYICEASNTVGTDQATTYVEVKYKPNFSSQQQTVFYGWVNSNTNLTCKANGNPEPIIRWSFGNSPIDETGNYIVRQGTSPLTTQAISYLIPTVRLENVDSIFGAYVCTAENRHGQSEQELQFVKAVLPGKPQLTVVDRKSTLLEIAITPPGNDGGQPVKEYIVKYGPPTASDPDLKTMRVDINPADRTNTKVQLRNLEAKTEYRIKVAAHTNVGIGLDADIVDSTLEVSVPGRVDITSDKNGLDGSRYTLTWVTTLTGGADITDYEIKYAKVEVTTDSNTGTWSVVRTPNDYKVVSVPGTSTSHVLENLDKNSYYHVGIVAVNRIGKSEESVFIFKTSLGAGATGDACVVHASIAGMVALACLQALVICASPLA